MPKLTGRKKPGRRKNIWILARHEATLADIDNHSKFFQLALDQAAGIMAWAILHEQKPKQFPLNKPPTDNQIKDFNEAFPLDPLTAQRTKKSANSPSKPELW